MIEKDVRNNSAWNQRFWVGEQQQWWKDENKCKEEVAYALDQARRAPSNESPWLYIRGIVQNSPQAVAIDTLEELAGKWILCIPVRSLLVYLYENVAKDGEKALTTVKELSETVDTIHAKYWNYKAKLLETKFK
jgi:protein farnesyltransferase/geranylgeranyltransferase type-1 subunit alpha